MCFSWFVPPLPGKSHKPFGNYPKPQLRDRRVLTAGSPSSSVRGSSCKLDVGVDGRDTHTPSDPWALVVFAWLGGK